MMYEVCAYHWNASAAGGNRVERVDLALLERRAGLGEVTRHDVEAHRLVQRDRDIVEVPAPGLHLAQLSIVLIGTREKIVDAPSGAVPSIA